MSRQDLIVSGAKKYLASLGLIKEASDHQQVSTFLHNLQAGEGMPNFYRYHGLQKQAAGLAGWWNKLLPDARNAYIYGGLGAAGGGAYGALTGGDHPEQSRLMRALGGAAAGGAVGAVGGRLYGENINDALAKVIGRGTTQDVRDARLVPNLRAARDTAQYQAETAQAELKALIAARDAAKPIVGNSPAVEVKTTTAPAKTTRPGQF